MNFEPLSHLEYNSQEWRHSILNIFCGEEVGVFYVHLIFFHISPNKTFNTYMKEKKTHILLRNNCSP